MTDTNKKRLFYSLFIPLIILLTLWLVFFIEWAFNLSFTSYGIYPRELSGLKGIFFSFFLHANIRHLIANSSAIFILCWILYFFFKDNANIILPLCIILSGLITFIIGRPAYHIGASSTIYALFFFLVVSSLFRKNRKLTAISLLVIFLYGGLVWNMIPISELIDPTISWEGHLSGAVTGCLVAFLFRKSPPMNDKEIKDDEEEPLDNEDIAKNNDDESQNLNNETKDNSTDN